MGVQLLNQGRPQALFIILLPFFFAIIFFRICNKKLSSTVFYHLLHLYYFINILFYLNVCFGWTPAKKILGAGSPHPPSQPGINGK